MLKAGTAARRRSLRFGRTLPAEEVRDAVERFLKQLDARLQERDPTWVGHCKLLVSSGPQIAYASMTAAGDSPRWAGHLAQLETAEITIYVALYSWTDGDVGLTLDALLASQPVLPEAPPVPH